MELNFPTTTTINRELEMRKTFQSPPVPSPFSVGFWNLKTQDSHHDLPAGSVTVKIALPKSGPLTFIRNMDPNNLGTPNNPNQRCTGRYIGFPGH